MNRAGLLLADCALGLPQKDLDFIRAHGGRTAIYCACEPSTTAHPEILQFLEAGSHTAYSRALPPKWGLQCSIGLAAAAVTVLLGIEGGLHTFIHPRWACLHALEQALTDLQEGLIDYALVGSANSAEDPLMVKRWRHEFPKTEFAEGAAVLFLGRGSARPPSLTEPTSEGLCFGTAHPLIAYLRGAEA